MKKGSSYHRQYFFVILLIACASAVWLLQDYVSLIIVTVLFSILVHPLYAWFHRRMRIQSGVSSMLTVFVTFFTIVIPLLLIATLVTQEALVFRDSIGQLITEETITIEDSLDSINALLATLPGQPYEITEADIEELLQQVARPSGSFIANRLVSIGTSSAAFLAHVLIFLVLVFFTLPILGRLKRYCLKISPLPDSIDRLYIRRIMAMTRAMIKGTFIVAVIQGVLAGLLLFSMGVQYILILTIIMTIMAIIPVMSTSLVTIPIAIYFILTGSMVKGLTILGIQLLIISSIDNILRPLFASGEGHLHPALLLLAILGGINVFGFLGILYGPIILIFLKTSLDVYEKHYR